MPKTIPNCGSYTVELDVGTLTNRFRIGDPVAGVIGNSLYPIGGTPDYRDVTEHVTRLSISRGRKNRYQEKSCKPGTARIVLENNNYYFSILNTASPYWNSTTGRLGFELGTGVKISREGQFLFVGSITSLTQSAERPKDSTVTINASDDLFKANNVKVPTQTVVAERSDERITKLLDSTGMFGGTRSLAIGVANLGLAPMDVGASLVEMLSRVNDSEQGRIFVSRSGVLTFQKRIDREPRNSRATLTDSSKDGYQTFEIVST